MNTILIASVLHESTIYPTVPFNHPRELSHTDSESLFILQCQNIACLNTAKLPLAMSQFIGLPKLHQLHQHVTETLHGAAPS